jgi:(S)-2-hydroxyglutarate dehydrogenase
MTHDIAIIGGGIVGLATAKALVERGAGSVVVIEAEGKLAAHQTGHNSGVIHSGIYYKPGSAKAKNCADGRDQLYRFCEEHGIPHDRCGKIVVATEQRELAALDEIERRGRANGMLGMKRLRGEELKEYEPNVAGIAGLFVAETGIVDYKAVTAKYAELVVRRSGTVQTNVRLLGVQAEATELVLKTTTGELRARHLINCAGLQSDRVARMCGVDPGVMIVPFRGEYYELRADRCDLVRNLIYPVPDPSLPFLGVHFTRMIGGGVEAGPNAVLAFHREGYKFTDFSIRDLKEMAGYAGFWKLSAKFWKTGLGEIRRSLSRYSFWASLRKLVPKIQRNDIVPAGAGVRAQAVGPDGKMVDDFHIRGAGRTVHVLNAPSPAATASLSIGRSIADLAQREFGLKTSNIAA